MRTTLPILAALALAGCGSDKGTAAPATTSKPIEAAKPAAAAPSQDEVAYFLEGWLGAVARRDVEATRAVSPTAVVEIAGCSDGSGCLASIHELAGVAQATALGDAKVEAVGDRARIVLNVEDLLIGTLELEMHRADSGMIVDRVRAEWKDGWVEPLGEDATAYVKTWLAGFGGKKKPAADAGLGTAIVATNPDCDTAAPCVGERLQEIMTTRPALAFEVLPRDKVDEYSDGTGKLRALERVTYVKVDVQSHVPGMEYAEITVALAMGRNDVMQVKGVEVESAYAMDTGD